MKTTVNKLPHSQIQLTIEVEQPTMLEYFARAFERLAPSVAIKGFRPGNAPKSLVLEKIGIDRYTQEAVNLAVIDTYYQAVHEHKLVPLHQPAVAMHEYGPDTSLVYDATVDVLPTVEVGRYQQLEVKLPTESTAADAQEVETVLKRLRLQAATFSPVDRPAQLSDRLEIHFTGKVKGVVQDDLTSQNYPMILGETPLIPGFEQELIGLKKDEEKTFKLTVESASRTGQPGAGKRHVEFVVQCLDVQATKLPELDESFAKNFGHDTVEALNAALKTGIESEKAEQLRRKQETAVLEALRTSITVELPQSLVHQEINRRIASIREQLGVTFDKLVAERYEGKLENLHKSLHDEAEKSVSAGLILGEIAQREKLVPEGGAKTPEEQSSVMRNTLDRLIEFAAGKKTNE